MDVAITELEKIDAERVDGVAAPASGIPILLMKTIGDGEAVKDWATWDAANQGSGRPPAPGTAKPAAPAGGKAATPSAFARAKQTIADHKAGKPVSAADLKNAHDVHEAHLAHLAHEAELKADGSAAAKPAAKAADDAVDCPTCEGDGKIMGGKRDCPDCDATGKVTPAKARQLAAKSLVQAIIAKAVGADGQVDEQPDIQGGTEVIGQIADLIIAEAQELKAGSTGEIDDIFQLARAAEAIWCWRTGEESVAAGSVMPATALMQSAREPWRDVPDPDMTGWPEADRSFFAAFKALTISKAKHSTADRKKLAESGNALSDGSYPIADEDDLKSAAILAQSGHGDVDGAKRLIGRRSKELGVKNPLAGDDSDGASKGAIAQEDTSVDTVTQGTGDLNKAVEAAIAKATAPLEKLRKELEETLAKVRATPVPGGPMLSRNVQVKQPGGVVSDDLLAKAALYRAKAEAATSPGDREGYLALARETEQQARTPSAT